MTWHSFRGGARRKPTRKKKEGKMHQEGGSQIHFTQILGEGTLFKTCTAASLDQHERGRNRDWKKQKKKKKDKKRHPALQHD